MIATFVLLYNHGVQALACPITYLTIPECRLAKCPAKSLKRHDPVVKRSGKWKGWASLPHYLLAISESRLAQRP